ncbi:hypothetical protein [Roseateles sp. P5_D6]
MNGLKAAAARLGTMPIEGEFRHLQLLSDAEFERAAARHLQRRRRPANADGAGVALVISLAGVPICLVSALFNGGDRASLFGATFWLVVGVALYWYLSDAAKYWRQHQAIRGEEFRRWGTTSFG